MSKITCLKQQVQQSFHFSRSYIELLQKNKLALNSFDGKTKSKKKFTVGLHTQKNYSLSMDCLMLIHL